MQDTPSPFWLTIYGAIPNAKSPQRKVVDYIKEFQSQCVGRPKDGKPLFKGYYEIEVWVHHPNKTHHLAFCAKLILHCLRLYHIIGDTSKCVKLSLSRSVDKTAPRILIKIDEAVV